MQKRIIYLSGQTIPDDEVAAEQELFVIVPAQDILLTKLTLPKLNASRLRQALPFSLEEQLIGDVSELHFAINEQTPEGEVSVAVVAKEKMQGWLALLRANKMEPAAIVPLTLVLPYSDHAWHCVVENNLVMIRISETQGFVCDQHNFATMLKIHLQKSEKKPKAIHIVNYTEHSLLPLQDIDMPMEEKFSPVHEFVRDISQFGQKEKPALNLLQGPFQPKRKLPTLKNAWLIAGSFSVATILLLFFGQIISLFILQMRVSATNKEITTIYQSYFPSSTSLVAPKERLQEKWQQLLGQASDSQIFLLLAELGKALSEAHVDIQRLDYQQNKMNLEVNASSFEILESFIQSLKTQGLFVQQQNAAMDEGKVKTTLVVALDKRASL